MYNLVNFFKNNLYFAEKFSMLFNLLQKMPKVFIFLNFFKFSAPKKINLNGKKCRIYLLTTYSGLLTSRELIPKFLNVYLNSDF